MEQMEQMGKNEITTKRLICFDCANWDRFDGCRAFADGEIPDEILLKNKHDKPIKGQKNDIVFEQLDPDDVIEKNKI